MENSDIVWFLLHISFLLSVTLHAKFGQFELVFTGYGHSTMKLMVFGQFGPLFNGLKAIQSSLGVCGLRTIQSYLAFDNSVSSQAQAVKTGSDSCWATARWDCHGTLGWQ